jgi:hypothetical protein
MQSASASGGPRLFRENLLERARQSVGGGQLVSAGLVILLSFTIARSTVTAHWVDGIEVITVLTLAASALTAVLAVSPLPWPAGIGISALVGPVVAAIAAAPVIHSAHPLDPVGLSFAGVWWERIGSGEAGSDPSFYLLLICLLMWVSGAWLSWCVIRWRKPMLGLIPGAAAFATNLLNYPVDQNGYTLAVLVLTLALLLWSTYTGSIAVATNARVRLMGDARWDFWESGLAAMAALIVIGVLLPPMSTSDRTVQIESSLFSNWAQLQQRLNNPGILHTGSGGGGGGVTGFSPDVGLGGPLQRTLDVVFTYTVSGDYAGPRYFRGLDVTLTSSGEWKYVGGSGGLRVPEAKNQIPSFSERYQKLAVATFKIDMVSPPACCSTVLFYPGQLYRVDRPSMAVQVPIPPGPNGVTLNTIDGLLSGTPATAAGTYTAEVESSTASVDDLRAAGTNYPDWVNQFATLPESGYRNPDVLQRIHQQALDIVNAAGATTPYDEATAIETYLRSDTFTYKLDPPQAPAGQDPLAFFLFDSHTGYCQYFATAMGDMLRSLGIPTRLVNGFGPGKFDSTTNRYVVRGEDAHTWVEAYFPGYGWIPFEPTNDRTNAYNPIARGTSGGVNLCLRDNGCDVAAPTPVSGPGAVKDPGRIGGNQDPGGIGVGPGGISIRSIDAGTLTRIAAILLAILLLVLAGLTRYLRPRTVSAVWNRTLALARMAGAERRTGETPFELARRLQGEFPEATAAVGALAGGFVVAAYAAPDLAPSARSDVMEAWTELRPLLLRRVVARVRRRGGRTL